jgi:DNA primase
MSDSEISKLSLEAFRLEASETVLLETMLPKFENRTLPIDAAPIGSFLNNIPKPLFPVLEYMANRNLCIDDYPFHWTPKTGFNDRLIIPYYYENRLVGYTARRIGSNKNPRYFSEQQPNFVFNLDRQSYERTFVIVCEGPIDAISIDGCAILGSQIKDKQDWLLKRLNKEIILVPDRDHEGPATVEQAIEYGWSVSMPEWPVGIKDVNDAVIKLGRLTTLWLIINAKQSYALKIQLRAKQFFKEGKQIKNLYRL